VYASPATVSRMGMIYLNEEDINIDGIINKWTDLNPHVKPYFENFRIRSFLGFPEAVASTIVGQVSQVLSQMKGSKNQSEFIAAVANGLTSNYLEDKPQLISKIF
jgi:dynein heavy chain 2